jgi:hypothetical protein
MAIPVPKFPTVEYLKLTSIMVSVNKLAVLMYGKFFPFRFCIFRTPELIVTVPEFVETSHLLGSKVGLSKLSEKE